LVTFGSNNPRRTDETTDGENTLGHSSNWDRISPGPSQTHGFWMGWNMLPVFFFFFFFFLSWQDIHK
jgi:hypothetical protein